MVEILRKTKAEMQARLEPTTGMMSLPKPLVEDDEDDSTITPSTPVAAAAAEERGEQRDHKTKGRHKAKERETANQSPRAPWPAR